MFIVLNIIDDDICLMTFTIYLVDNIHAGNFVFYISNIYMYIYIHIYIYILYKKYCQF